MLEKKRFYQFHPRFGSAEIFLYTFYSVALVVAAAVVVDVVSAVAVVVVAVVDVATAVVVVLDVDAVVVVVADVARIETTEISPVRPFSAFKIDAENYSLGRFNL